MLSVSARTAQSMQVYHSWKARMLLITALGEINDLKEFIVMKKIYIVPEVIAYEVVAERGYENSTSFGLPDYGTDTDDWA